MRKISANYIFPINSTPIKNGIIIVSDEGTIINIIDPKNNFQETSKTEFYNGVIVPGFINSHCHLELSHLKGAIPKKTGHVGFISQIVEKISSVKSDFNSISEADKQMQTEGIVAVGDISNTDHSAEVKRNSPIYYHTFIELADFFDSKIAEKRISFAQELEDKFDNVSIVAHAPYTCSSAFIGQTANLSEKVYSIHNQEAEQENLMYLKGQGELFDLIKKRNFEINSIITNTSSIRAYLENIRNKDLNIILVHNLFTSEIDIEFAENLSKNVYWCFCPNSNDYIQGIKPDLNIFLKNNCKICLGTDSLATNDRLSILEEMKNFRDFNFDEVIKWATINGAKALGIDEVYGSIEIGKKPGLNLISNFDFQNMHLKKDSFLKKIV